MVIELWKLAALTDHATAAGDGAGDGDADGGGEGEGNGEGCSEGGGDGVQYARSPSSIK